MRSAVVILLAVVAIQAGAECVRKEEPLAPGVMLVEWTDAERPLRAWAVKIDRMNAGLRFDVVNAADGLGSVKPLAASAAALRRACGVKPVVGVNADLFAQAASPSASRTPVGCTARMSASHGEFYQSGYLSNESGTSSYLYETTDGTLRTGPVRFRGTVELGGKSHPVLYVNTAPAGLPAERAAEPSAMGVFTHLWPQGMPRDGWRIRFRKPFGTGGSIAVKEKKFDVLGRIRAGAKLPKDDPLAGAVVPYGPGSENLPYTGKAAPKEGALTYAFSGASGRGIRNLVGIRNEPMKEGVVVATDEEAGSPRTLFGMNAATGLFVLFVVDGRRPGWSASLTSREAAEWLRNEGCTYCGQFDGGGSTTLWTEKGVVNRPSDPFGARPLGSAVFFSRPPRE